MCKYIFLLIIVLISCLFVNAEEETPNYKTISTVVSGAIATLEAKDVDKFFKEYVSPKDLKSIKEDLEKTKKEFAEGEKLKSLIFVLKKLEKIAPTYSKERDILTFKSAEIGTLSFSREDGKWYIKN